MIGQPLYKASAVAGHTWHEWIKMGPARSLGDTFKR